LYEREKDTQRVVSWMDIYAICQTLPVHRTVTQRRVYTLLTTQALHQNQKLNYFK